VSMRPGAQICILVVLVAVARAVAAAADGPPVEVRVEVEPRQATVGDRLTVRVVVDLPPATRLDPPQLGPALGPFSVVEGSWSAPEEHGEGRRWTWTGVVVSFRPGRIELPAVRLVVEDEGGTQHAAQSQPVSVEILSVLDPAEPADASAEIADLKPPAGVPPDYGSLVTAAGILALLLSGTALLWWLHRRYASRLAAVPTPDDPFHRTPPHEWVYAELQKLLERRLAEQGQEDLFFAEIARILKLYLGGRFRVELMEQTTAEVPYRLGQAGAPDEAIGAVRDLLARCDLVKFAKEHPRPEDCRGAIEAAYKIVDATKPGAKPAERGAA
jgi:hypothetical protein